MYPKSLSNSDDTRNIPGSCQEHTRNIWHKSNEVQVKIQNMELHWTSFLSLVRQIWQCPPYINQKTFWKLYWDPECCNPDKTHNEQESYDAWIVRRLYSQRLELLEYSKQKVESTSLLSHNLVDSFLLFFQHSFKYDTYEEVSLVFLIFPVQFGKSLDGIGCLTIMER